MSVRITLMVSLRNEAFTAIPVTVNDGDHIYIKRPDGVNHNTLPLVQIPPFDNEPRITPEGIVASNKNLPDAFIVMMQQTLDAFEERVGRHIEGMWKPADDVPPALLEEMRAAFKDVGEDN